MRRVLRSERAKRDLLEIWRYVAEDDSSTADNILRDIDRKIALLPTLPYMGRPRPDIDPAARGVISGPFLILYRATDDEIDIVRIVHGRRNLRNLV